MTNPFEKRATEYLVDNEAFLAVVTPEPLITFFGRSAKDGSLYDRLAVITGTPGSGKTTLARLFEYSTLRALLRTRGASTYRSLSDALVQCRVLKEGTPQILGARVPLESEYRNFWEFPYPEETRLSLTTALLQARSMIRWLRQLADSGIDLAEVSLVSRLGAEASLAQIGGTNGEAALARARDVELAIYRIVRALVPPPLSALEGTVNEAYHPFDVLQAVQFPVDGSIVECQPLVMFDDAHSLHPAQYEKLERWLSQREMRIGRWILTRLDALKPAHVLGTDGPGVQKTRVITDIRMQAGDRAKGRTAFRKMARDMSSRYLGQMDIFSRRRLTDFADLLATDPPPLSPAKLTDLRKRVDRIQAEVGASPSQRAELEERVDAYFSTSTVHVATDELRLAVLAIALERFGKRVPQLTLGFGGGEDELEPNRPVTIDASVVDGARIRLHHDAGYPYYFGFEALCDASAENAEQFLQLASRLVSQAETHLIRGKGATLAASEQDKLVRRRAAELIHSWDFPTHRDVRRMTDVMARECVQRSLEGNASLGGGASAWGIPQEQFDRISIDHPEIARVLQFAVAYNAVILKPGHLTKKRAWCLIELGGPVLVRHGLTLKRGGFLERDVRDLSRSLDGDARA